MNKRIFLPLFISVFFLLSGCLSDSDTERSSQNGEITDLNPDSKTAKEYFRFLVGYLEEKKPEIADLVLVSARSQFVSGETVTLVCRYKERNKDFFLKAVILTDDNGTKRVMKILFSYEYGP